MPSFWFQGGLHGRSTWKFPCVAASQCQNLMIGDSQSKIYGKNRKEKKNWMIMSYSGADMIEMIQVLKCGKVWDEENKPIIKKTEREHIQHGKEAVNVTVNYVVL
jgi:hypothetical protein